MQSMRINHPQTQRESTRYGSSLPFLFSNVMGLSIRFTMINTAEQKERTAAEIACPLRGDVGRTLEGIFVLLYVFFCLKSSRNQFILQNPN